MTRNSILKSISLLALTLIICIFFGCSQKSSTPTLRVGIAPYQDMAMLMNIEPLGLEDKYKLDIELVTMAWSDLTPAVSSAGKTVDVAFASLTQFISQQESLNSKTKDPIVFFYPAYVFKGGAFVSFNDSVPVLDKSSLKNIEIIKKFLKSKIAVQKTSSYEMLLFELSQRVGQPFNDLSLIDMDSGDGLLAAINGSVDISSAGLTQKNEALQKGGKVVLEMEAMGQVDIAGFIAKKSVIEKRRVDIEKMVNMWVDTIAYVMEDIDNNAKHSIAYLDKQSSTNYTIEQYKTALSLEVLPISIDQIVKDIISKNGRYYYGNVRDIVGNYYIHSGHLKKAPEFIDILQVK